MPLTITKTENTVVSHKFEILIPHDHYWGQQWSGIFANGIPIMEHDHFVPNNPFALYHVSQDENDPIVKDILKVLKNFVSNNCFPPLTRIKKTTTFKKLSVLSDNPHLCGIPTDKFPNAMNFDIFKSRYLGNAG
ncbi:hypothetical protein CL653_03375 [bacterium]|nr:hypothetical protein [bacterium]|tara:strand:- start:896 stop:1297 length:402 start_codon:yes stop_codon:yes gene_type:complete